MMKMNSSRHDGGQKALVPRPEPREPEPQDDITQFHGPYTTCEQILHRRVQRAESDVARLIAREREAQERLYELSKQLDAAVRPGSAPSLEQYRMAVEDRNFAVARQAELETRIAELEAASAPSRLLEEAVRKAVECFQAWAVSPDMALDMDTIDALHDLCAVYQGEELE